MDKKVSDQIKDLISKNANIGIAVGKNPAVDEMASALSLYLVLKNDGKNVKVVSPSDALVEHSGLVGIDKLSKDFGASGGDMTVSFPYQEGEIDKISYTLEGGFLNIIVKAGELGLSFDEKDVIFKRSEGYPSLLFVIGTSRLSDLERIYDPEALKDTTVINIDNKADNQGYGDVSIVSTGSSSISEKVADLILSMGYHIDIDVAQNLLSGIEAGTDNFQSRKTTPLAFEMTGELIRKGATRGGIKPRSEIAENFPPEPESMDDSYDDFPFEDPMIAPAPMPAQNLRPMSQAQAQDRRAQMARTLQNLQRLQQRQRGQAAPRQNPQRQDLTERKDRKSEERGKNPPTDWLTPKIYKGSTNI